MQPRGRMLLDDKTRVFSRLHTAVLPLGSAVFVKSRLA